MTKKTTVTVGIPAFNEAANIGNLLVDLLNQKTVDFDMEKIIVYSDGSTDETSSIVNRFKINKVFLIQGKKRKGVKFGINTLFKYADSEILVLLNADTRISDVNFLSRITKPIRLRGCDLVSCRLKEISPSTYFENILIAGVDFKNGIFEDFLNGKNIYTCHGPVRVYSKRLYKRLKIKYSSGDDMYSYLFALKNRYKYDYVKRTFVYYKLPSNFIDHKKQSVRFFTSKRRLLQEFEKDLVSKEMFLPKNLVIKSFFRNFRKYHFNLIIYFLIVFLMNVYSKIVVKEGLEDKWSIAESSKDLNFK